MYPGNPAKQTSLAIGQKNVSWHSGRRMYPGIRAEESILAFGRTTISWHSGTAIYPGIRVQFSILANRSILEKKPILAKCRNQAFATSGASFFARCCDIVLNTKETWLLSWIEEVSVAHSRQAASMPDAKEPPPVRSDSKQRAQPTIHDPNSHQPDGQPTS